MRVAVKQRFDQALRAVLEERFLQVQHQRRLLRRKSDNIE
jgi:hypothetical protein